MLQLTVGAETWNAKDHNDAHRDGDEHQRGEGVSFLELFEFLEHVAMDFVRFCLRKNSKKATIRAP